MRSIPNSNRQKATIPNTNFTLVFDGGFLAHLAIRKKCLGLNICKNPDCHDPRRMFRRLGLIHQ